MVNAPLTARATPWEAQNPVGEASMKMSKRRWCFWLCIALSSVGCARGDGITPPAGSALCPQGAGEFGSYGCAVVAGQVRGANGAGLPGATVIVIGSAKCGGCYAYTTVADQSGSFRVTVHLWVPLLGGAPLPDTVTAMVRASATGPYPRPSATTTYGDSASTVLVFAPVGAPSHAANVTLTIAWP
jgi:hypothetical protein